MNYKHQLPCFDDTLKKNSYHFSKPCPLFHPFPAHSREFLNKSNYSEVSSGGQVMLFLVQEEHGKSSVFNTYMRRYTFVSTM